MKPGETAVHRAPELQVASGGTLAQVARRFTAGFVVALACAVSAMALTLPAPQSGGESSAGSSPSQGPGGRPGVWHHFGDKAGSAPAPPPAGTKSAASGLAKRPGGRESLVELEKEMFELINRDRQSPAYDGETHGRAAPLGWDPALAAVATAHSEDMLSHGYFGHLDRQGRAPGKRVAAAGIRWQAVGENIAINSSVQGANSAMMREPAFEANHRGIILNPRYTEVGVGIVRARNGELYITEDFIERPGASRASF